MIIPVMPLALLASFFTLYIGSLIIARLRHARQARELGCKPPVRRPHRLPLGIDIVKRMMDADKDKTLPNMVIDVYDEIGQPNTYIQNVLGTDVVTTVEPKNLQALLATQFNDFEIGDLRRNNFFPLLGNGIFTTDGKPWEHARAMLRPNFVRDQVIDPDVEEHHVQDLLHHVAASSSGWTDTVDLAPLFFGLTLDSSTEFLFGESVGSQIDALPDGHPAKVSVNKAGALDWTAFGPNFDAGTMALGTRGRLAEMFWLYNPSSFKKNCVEVHKFADYYVNLALNPPEKKSGDLEKGSKKYIFLEELVKATRDPVELRSQLLNILIAGRDTTSGLLGYVFYHLARNPDVFIKLRETILDTFGTYKQPRNLDFSSMKSCVYLQHVLSETLRFNASVPINSRRAVKDTSIPLGGGPDGKSPVYIKKGDEVNYHCHVMHHRTDLWGPDARQWKPERWANRKSGWEFLPFNGGPRICLGQQHALSLAGYTIIRLLQKFDKLENMDKDPVFRHQYSVTASPAYVKLRLHEADE